MNLERLFEHGLIIERENMGKGVIFLPDGMADLPLKELEGKTPLEAVDTPAMDAIAARGSSGTFLTLPEGLPTSSDVANMSVLGLCPEDNYPGRGPIEAASQNIILKNDDIAWRCNLVTVSAEGILTDYSAGQISDADSKRLMSLLQDEFGDERISFHHGVSYRNLLVLHGREFSARVDYHKPDSSHGIPISKLGLTPADDSAEAAHTVAFLNDLMKRAADFLAAQSSGQATHIWPWSPGQKPTLALFSELYPGRTGAVISAVDVIKGIGKCIGMTIIDVPGATGYIDTNYRGKADAAIKALETHDFVYVHVEAMDECSHAGDLKLKMQAIADFDRLVVAPVLEALKHETVVFAVLPDHPAPVELRQHTTVPVPVAVCGPGIPVDEVRCFSETEALRGGLGLMKRMELMRMILK